MDAYEVLTQGCGLVDRSESGKLALTGDQAAEMLNGLVTNDVEALEPGHGLYAAYLTPKGRMLGDVRVLRREDELLLLCERSALQDLFDLLRRGVVGWRAELHKRTVQMALFSLVGPAADAVLDMAAPPAHEHAHVPVLGGVAVRTDLGADVVVPAERAGEAKAWLLERGAVEVDEAAAEVVRVERGRPRYGVDLDSTVIPQEAGLNDRAVSFTKGCYVGQETVARLFYKGKPNRRLRGLALDAPVEPGAVLRAGEREAGRVGSAVVSPARGPLALAFVRREVEDGAEVEVGDAGVRARVVALPFGDAA
ncbi:folate-binding protein YgfZ [Conexibacter sp. SYSU D00693]|uniref:CAF17-like 4Fe-4S cluster assembly/insertion protein YgfZ n=1 Tax=Conexibacter sp. SYSU D00693 TaxID=2812560 RepID=UPI001F120F20|nr:glycine cleavage T C-terminal barrel domain-containing protein [Conexibacter sp. SYSU D00693]